MRTSNVVVVALALVLSCAGDEPYDVDEVVQRSDLVAIPANSVWVYWDDGGDLGTAWRSGSYDDGTWQRGTGPLGYGETYQHTTLSYGPDATDKYITAYFRHTFVIDAGTVVGAHAELMYDDGIVVYLNGTEIERRFMPEGDLDASTEASGHETGNNYESVDWSAHAALFVAGENTVAVEVHQHSPSSSDLMFDLALGVDVDDSEPPATAVGGIDRNDAWAVWDYDAAPVGAWTTRDYDDGAWRVAGPAPLGYGEIYIGATLSYGDDPSDKFITAYARHAFSVDEPSAVTELLGEVMYDDGVVVYLNGTEIARLSMPDGAIDHDTLALGHDAAFTYEAFDWSEWTHLLVAGDNEVAVEVHQWSPSSSDLVFDLSIVARDGDGDPDPDPEPVAEDIARGSTWAYWDRGTEPERAWRRSPDYDDAAWSRGDGPLGYGEDYVETTVSYGADPTDKHITTYFRKVITVDAPTIETTLRGELLYDDGAVVYLNGREVTRLAMPDGFIRYDTLSTGHESGRYEVFDWTSANEYLIDGENVIAVEVHQVSPRSSDLTFDLALEVNTPAACAIPGCAGAAAPAPDTTFYDVWAGELTVWTVGSRGVIGRRDADARWCWCAPDPEAAWSGVWGASDDDVWIVGSNGRALRHDGADLTAVDVGTDRDLRAVWGSAANDVVIVGYDGTARRFDGTDWHNLDLDPSVSLDAVWGSSASDVWIGGAVPAPHPENPEFDGYTAVLYRSTAGGGWTLEGSFTMFYGAAQFSGIHGTSADDVWAVGSFHPAGAAASYSQVVRFDGVQWEQVPMSDPYGQGNFRDVLAEPDQVVVTSGDHHPAPVYDGAMWSYADPITSRLNGIDESGGVVWAVGGGGKILRRDGGAWIVER